MASHDSASEGAGKMLHFPEHVADDMHAQQRFCMYITRHKYSVHSTRCTMAKKAGDARRAAGAEIALAHRVGDG